MARPVLLLLIRATLLTACCVAVGLVFNAVRPEGIALIAPRPYEIFVPCPEGQAEAQQVNAEQLNQQEELLYLDARPQEEYQREHIKGAISFPYPVLGEPDADQVQALKTKGRPIVTYGQDSRDRLGEMMAALLTELGLDQVTSLEGGLRAWRDQGGAVETTTEPTKEPTP
jgi:rhodanese-related sulfurtransferase